MANKGCGLYIINLSADI